MSTEAVIPGDVLDAIRSGDPAAIKACAARLDTEALETGRLSDATVEWYLALFTLPEFLQSRSSSGLVLAIEDNWTEWSDIQKQRLLIAIVLAYPSFADWMSCFAITELLGEYYGGAQAVQALRQLREASMEMPRKFLPHGLEHVVKLGADREASLAALAELRILLSDPAEEVRTEASDSVARLVEHGRRVTSHPRAPEIEKLAEFL